MYLKPFIVAGLLLIILLSVDQASVAQDTPRPTVHIDTSATAWYSSSQYPEALRKVYRYKPLIGGDPEYWRGIIPHDEVLMGYLVLDAGATYPGHAHPSPEIYYVVDGQAEWTVGDETFAAKPGTAIYTPPNTLHRMINTGDRPLRTIYYWWAPGGDKNILHTGSKLVESVPKTTGNEDAAPSLERYFLSEEPQEYQHHHVYLNEVDWTTNWSYPEALQKVYRYKPLIGGDPAEWPGIPQDDVYMGLQELDTSAVYPGHMHPAPEIYFVLSGTAEWTVGDKSFRASSGTAVYIPPKTIHRVANKGSEPLRWIYFWWAPGGNKEVLNVGSTLLEPVPDQH